jgi:type VI secretion system secreted protein VgrG
MLVASAPSVTAWSQSNGAENERQIAAQRTAVVVRHATFEAVNAAAIARHGAAELPQTPGATYTPEPTSTPVPAPAATPTSTRPPDEPTPQPCAMQYSWQLLLDDQGNPITRLDGEVVEGLWEDSGGEQMWAPSTYFCSDSADTPTPTDESTPTATSRPTHIADQPSTVAVEPAPATQASGAVAVRAVRIVERVVVAMPTDTPEPTNTPAPIDTPEASTTPTRMASPTLTATATRTSTPVPTAAAVLGPPTDIPTLPVSTPAPVPTSTPEPSQHESWPVWPFYLGALALAGAGVYFGAPRVYQLTVNTWRQGRQL